MDDSPETSRRGFLRSAGVALAGGVTGLPGSGSAVDTAAGGHYVALPLGSNVWYNRVNRWSQPYHQQAQGPYQFSRWERKSSVEEAPQSVMEAVYGESMAPRKLMKTIAVSYGGAGDVITDAWAGVEFYTTGTTARTARITAYGEYDEGENFLNLREVTGGGYVANLLDLSVMDISAGSEIARGQMYQHQGYPGNVASSGQRDPLVWATTNVTAALHPNRYYGIYFVGRSRAYSTSPITGAWHPPEAGASQRVGIGHIYVNF